MDETGSQVVEFGLVLLPLMAVTFLIMDVAWVCFAQASLQHAVQAGVRAAVSSYVPTTFTGGNGTSYIKSVVQKNAMGFLGGQSGMNQITINYFNPANLSNPVSCAGGNVVQVSVADVPVSTLVPLWVPGSTLLLKASSSDVLESVPSGTTCN